jgi:primosomal protein N' (replication factor Y)
MIGPRSAIFTPFDRLGAIIIDEEHETTYKSETNPKYNVKELAFELSRLTGCLVLLGSASPLVETYRAALEGGLELFELDRRVNNMPPKVSVIDMRKELALGNRTIFGNELREAIAENLRRGELTILFLNRRGHSTFVSCRACGHVLSCGQCSINYTYHITSDRLMCHYCGEEAEVPKNCPVCGSLYIKYFGVGTQKIEEEIRRSFPGVRTLRMDLDTTTKKHSHENIYRSFLDGAADILIGTQMIAKGLDFPRVTLVGIIAADINIHMGDFRSAEKAYQLITQVSGRAGRAELPGRVFIQTYNPEHYSIEYAKNDDYRAFYEHEIEIRRQMLYPPFSHLFVVLMTGENEKKVVTCLSGLYRLMTGGREDFEIFPPTPAVVSKIKNVFRHKLIVKGFDEEELKAFVFANIELLLKNTDTEGVVINNTLDPLNIP